MRIRRLFVLAGCLGASFLSGCERDSYSPPPEPVLYPVKGKVTAAGKPLAHAVVTFLQVDEKGTTSIGETDDEGLYELSYVTKPGTAAATYKVAISYLEGKDGTIYGLAPRSGLSKPYGMITAKERIPAEWSDLGRTTQRATVPVDGGTFDFDIKEPLLPPPVPDTPADGEKKPPAGAEKAEASKPPAKAETPPKAGSPGAKKLPGT